MTFDPAALAAPFPPDAISWRAQSVTKDGAKAMALAYIDARDVMARLDEVCGPADWQDSYTETAKGRIICTLSLRIGGEWIAKSDGAGNTDVEADKGALSDALKRAAVKWGIGRYLYDMDTPWAECESYQQGDKFKWRKWTEAGWATLRRAAAAVPITNAQWAELAALIEATNADLSELCKYYGVESLRALPAFRFEHARAALNKKLPKAA